MCGFTGFWSLNKEIIDNEDEIVKKMADEIIHRGPDDFGFWSDKNLGITFGFRRLSVVELSQAGRQPMISDSGRYVIMFNGEIYNHLTIRLELFTKSGWRGNSDTETILAGFEAWGLEKTLNKCVGMFSIALWDRVNKRLHLIRDRFGEKPLYYGWHIGKNNTFLFGSELKSLAAFRGFNNPVSSVALTQYMRFTYVPVPYSIYANIYKLEPGCILTIDGFVPSVPNTVIRPDAAYESIKIKRWWSLKNIVEKNATNKKNSIQDASKILEQGLKESIKLQSIADVPLGAFLSGGVDSSTVVALMQEQSMKKIKTFTIGFEDANYDESTYAAAVARHLGTEHNEFIMTSKEGREVIPLLPHIYDEPFADSSQIPTYLVSKIAKNKVTVALSGDGGDELFGGYNRYFLGPSVWRQMSKLPFAVRSSFGRVITKIPTSVWDHIAKTITTVLPKGRGGVIRFGEKTHKLGRRLDEIRNLDDLYLSLVSEWTDLSLVVKTENFIDKSNLINTVCVLEDPLPSTGVEQPQLRMMFKDSISYLTDDILCKVDRAGMSVSLETRIPFLDYRVAEIAWGIPLEQKIRGNLGKIVLKDVLYKYVPRELIERPKAGFAIPLGDWLRGPLRDWAEDLLNEKRLVSEGYFHSAPIRKLWTEHLLGWYDHTTKLWTVLMFQAWLVKQGKHSSNNQ